MRLHTDLRLMKTFVGWFNVEVFAPPHHDRPMVCLPVADWKIGLEPSGWLVVPSPSVLANYPSLTLCGSKADKVHVWQIRITEFLEFALVSFFSAARNDLFMSKEAE